MCVLIKNQGATIPYVDFLKIWRINQDGVGIAYYDRVSQFVDVHKSFVRDSISLKKWYDSVYIPIISNPKYDNVVIHFRYATDGDICEKNIHPFPFTDHNGTLCYAFHNGIMHNQYRNYSIWNSIESSDTANFVRDFLCYYDFDFSNLAKEDRESIQIELLSSKLIVLTENNQIHTFNENLGIYKGDNWFSNMRWDYVQYNQQKLF